MGKFYRKLQSIWVRHRVVIVVGVGTGIIANLLVYVAILPLASILWDTAYPVLIRLNITVFDGYVDSLHENIGKGSMEYVVTEQNSFIIRVIMMLLGFCLAAYLIICESIELFARSAKQGIGKYLKTEPLSEPLSKDDLISFLEKISVVDNILPRKYKIGGLSVLMVVVVFVSVSYAMMSMKTSYTSEAATFVEQSIEILAPHISSEEVLELRAAYRSVDKAFKFYELESKLKQIAEEKDIALPDFTSLGQIGYPSRSYQFEPIK